MKDEIFKVQLPVASNAPNPLGLAYNRTRSPEIHFTITASLAKRLQGKLKSFWWAHLDEQGTFVLTREAPWQNW